MSEQPIFALDLPDHPAPSKIAAVRCKFCRSAIPIEDEGATAWRICDECWPHVCFEADL